MKTFLSDLGCLLFIICVAFAGASLAKGLLFPAALCASGAWACYKISRKLEGDETK